MDIKKSSAIILSVKSSGEGDVAARGLTKEYGKKNFIIKGLKKSKKRPQIDSGSIVDIVYYSRGEGNINTAKELSVLRTPTFSKDDLSGIYKMLFMLEAVDKTTMSEQKLPQLYNLLSSGIEAAASEEGPALMLVFFTLRLMKVHGILPDFERCVSCGGEISAFSVDTGKHGIRCTGCSEKKTVPYSEALKNFIITAKEKRFSSIDKSGLNAPESMSLLFDLISLLESYFSIDIKSKKFL